MSPTESDPTGPIDLPPEFLEKVVDQPGWIEFDCNGNPCLGWFHSILNSKKPNAIQFLLFYPPAPILVYAV